MLAKTYLSVCYFMSKTMHQFSSVTKLWLTLWDPMDCSTPGFPVHHQLMEPTQTHVHWVSDGIQPSHPLSSPSPPAFNLSQHQGLFQGVNPTASVQKLFCGICSVFKWSFNELMGGESALCIRWPKCWSFSFSISPSSECSGLISFRTNWLYLCTLV